MAFASSSVKVEPPIAVLSDLHLGHAASFVSEPDMLLPLFADARAVVFNGDTSEQLNVSRRGEAFQKTRLLAELCLERGCMPIFITGNHDPLASSAHYWDLLEGRVFVTHGDVLHPLIGPWSREAAVIGAERRRLLANRSEPESLDELLLLTKRCALVASRYDPKMRRGLLARLELISRFARKPWRIAITLRYWANAVHAAHVLRNQFRPASRLMLIGHTHRPGVWQLRDLILVNTGSFQPLSRPLVVVLEADHAFVYQVVQRASRFERGRVLHRIRL
jgi:predicted phosphodiesterase